MHDKVLEREYFNNNLEVFQNEISPNFLNVLTFKYVNKHLLH